MSGQISIQLTEFCKEANHLLLYGAGRYAKVVFSFLEIMGMHAPEGCLQSGKIGAKDSQFQDCIPIISVDDYQLKEKEEYSIILSLQDIFHDDVKRNVEKHFGKRAKLLCLHEDDINNLQTEILRKEVISLLSHKNTSSMNEESYSRRISEIISGYDTIEVSYIRMCFIGDAFDWIRFCKENESKKDRVFRLYYPVTFPHQKLTGANAYMLGKFRTGFQEVITKDNIEFWSYFYQQKKNIFEITGDIYRENDQSKQFNNFVSTFVPDNESFILFDKKEEQLGKSELKRIGIREKYACFCIRDELYRRKMTKQNTAISTLTNKYRNSDQDNYRKGVESLKDHGYQAVRMGAMVESPINWNNVIDYAYYHRSEFLDLYLMKNCAFFISNPSGIQALAQLFSKPLLSVNVTIFTTRNDYLLIRGVNDISIYVKYYNPKANRFLTLREILDRETNDKYHEICAPGTFLQYEMDGIIKVENTPEEINDAIQEMVGRLEGTFEYDDEDIRLQAKFQKILDKYPMGKNYPFKQRIGAKFIKENKWLLD